MRILLEKAGLLTRLGETGGKRAARTENDIHQMIERNLPVVFPGLELVASKKGMGGFVPDTVAFDSESRSFVIIEYKNSASSGLVEQGDAYYQLIKERPEAFLQAYADARGRILKKGDVRWGKTRVVLISPEFTKRQMKAGLGYYPRVEMYRISKHRVSSHECGVVTLDLVNGRS